MSDRMRQMLDFVSENSGDRTHPDGCLACTFSDGLGLVAWPVLVNLCPHEHPSTIEELEQQYADNGWSNIDGSPTDAPDA